MMEGFSKVFDPIDGERTPSTGPAHTRLVFRKREKMIDQTLIGIPEGG